MNTKVKLIFTAILQSANKLQNEVTNVLQTYRKEREEAQRTTARYIDGAEEFERQRSFLASVARENIEKSERVFGNSLKENVGKLKAELMEHLNAPMSTTFVNELSLIRQFGLKPTRAEIEHLIAANAGNSIGLSALSSVLVQNGSPYRVTGGNTEQFEKDIASLSALSYAPRYVPYELHTEGTEVLKGTERTFTRDDGSLYQNGSKWDSVSIGVARSGFESTMKEVEKMQERWSADISYPSIEEVALRAKQEAEKNGETVPEEPKSAVSIEEDDGTVEAVRERAHVTAEQQETYDRTMRVYQQ